MLFLQLLSYYVKTFNTKQFVVSIQTRMPVMKIDKNWHSRKLLVEGKLNNQIIFLLSDYFESSINHRKISFCLHLISLKNRIKFCLNRSNRYQTKFMSNHAIHAFN
jgi:hypothetical protein